MAVQTMKRTRDVKWTRELTSTLIFLWEQNELLYNSNHEDHISKIKRTEALEKICQELKKLNIHVTVQGIRKKIHSLCTLYAAEYKNWRTNDYYVPQLWCFELLNFLTKGFTPKSSKSNIDTSIIDLDDDSCSNEEVSRSSEKTLLSDKSKSISKKPKKTSVDQIKQVLILKEFFNNKLKNRYEWLGQQVHVKMNSIKDESIRKETADAIEHILIENISKDKSSSQLNIGDYKNFLLTNTFPVIKRKKSKPLDPGVNEIQQKVLSLNGMINEKIITINGGLPKQVVDRVSRIQDEEIREDTAWAIQCILKENVERDKYFIQQNNSANEDNNTEVVDSTNLQNVESFISSIWDEVNVDIEV